MVSKAAISLVPASTSNRKERVAISPVPSMDNKAATSPVSRVDMLLSVVVISSVAAISPVNKAAMVLSVVVTSSVAAISLVPRAVIASILLATILMLSIA